MGAPARRTLVVVARPARARPAWLALTAAVKAGAPKRKIAYLRAGFNKALKEYE